MSPLRSPSVTIPISAPAASDHADHAEPLGRHLEERLAHGHAVPRAALSAPAVHEVRDLGEPGAEPPARMQAGEVLGVKARLSISATASASPSASVIVVEVVGARPTEQASGAGGSTSAMSAARSRVELAFPATPISGIPKRRV